MSAIPVPSLIQYFQNMLNQDVVIGHWHMPYCSTRTLGAPNARWTVLRHWASASASVTALPGCPRVVEWYTPALGKLNAV